MSFVLIGDLHLGKLDHHRPEFLSHQLRTLNQVLKATHKEHGLSEVVLAGDVFDVPKPPQKIVASLLLLLKEHPLKYYVILGNHDRAAMDEHSCELASAVAEQKFLDLTVVTEPKIYSIGGSKVFLCPHPYAKDQPLKADFSIGHFPWTGAKRDNGTKEPNGKNPKGKWLLGDFHTYQEGKRFAYPGSLTQLTFGEGKKGSKNVYFVVDEDGSFQPKESPVAYCLKTIELETKDDVKAFLKTLRSKESGPKTFWSVKCGSGITPPAEIVQHTNVLYCHSARSIKVDTTAASSFAMDLLDPLPDWLKARKTLTPKQSIRALKIAQGLNRSKGISS